MRRQQSAALAAAALALSGCNSTAELPADPAANLDPIAFFTGRSIGSGTVDPMLGSNVPIRVDSLGRRQGDTLILDQRIREGDKPPRLRRWVMRPAGTNRYTGTLTDAEGPVEFTTAGPRATIRYTMKDGLAVEQQLALQSDGRTLLNRLDVRKFGLSVATLDETIRKVG